MVKARHIIHIFFSSDEPPPIKGLLKYGSTEIYLFYLSDSPPSCTNEIENQSSWHKIQLSPILQDSYITISDTLEDMIRENALICVNLNNPLNIFGMHAIMVLKENLEQFHQFDRPILGKFATVFAYQIYQNTILTTPIIPSYPDICAKIYRILTHSSSGLSKRDLIDKFADLGDETTIDQMTNALIIFENWLTFYPGFEVEQIKQKRKIYRIQE